MCKQVCCIQDLQSNLPTLLSPAEALAKKYHVHLWASLIKNDVGHLEVILIYQKFTDCYISKSLKELGLFN